MFKRHIWAPWCLGACHEGVRSESYLNIALQLYLIAPGKMCLCSLFMKGNYFRL